MSCFLFDMYKRWLILNDSISFCFYNSSVYFRDMCSCIGIWWIVIGYEFAFRIGNGEIIENTEKSRKSSYLWIWIFDCYSSVGRGSSLKYWSFMASIAKIHVQCICEIFVRCVDEKPPFIPVKRFVGSIVKSRVNSWNARLSDFTLCLSMYLLRLEFA